jgi:hypothetical protein
MIKVGNSYALGDPLQPTIAADTTQKYPPRPDYWNNNHNKRREDFPDRRYGVHHVASVQENVGRKEAMA